MSGLLMDERFVAVFPSLVRRLGSLEAAVILQHLHFNADRGGDIHISMAQISEETGIGERTVRRVTKWLRDEGWVTARRASAGDATLVYQIVHERLSVGTRANAQVDVANLAGSDPANLAGSSIQKVRTTTPVVEEVTVPEPAAAAAPKVHPSRAIDSDWSPSRPYVLMLRSLYPRVDLQESCRRFVAFHISRQDTSRSWEASFMVWASQDEQRLLDQTKGGTDDLGTPLNQRGGSSVPEAARPGDADYVDPEEIHAAAMEAARRSTPTTSVTESEGAP